MLTMTSNNFSVQFKLGLAGIISSLIWIGSKFGLFSISNFEWLSLCGIIYSLVLFYHYYDLEENSFSFLSVFLFFISITFFVYFNQNQSRNSHTSFDFSFFIFVFSFSLGAFLLIKSFLYPKKINQIFVSMIFLIGTILIFVFKFKLNIWIMVNFGLFNFDKILNYLITILLFALLLYPTKNIIKIIKQINQNRNNVPLS